MHALKKVWVLKKWKKLGNKPLYNVGAKRYRRKLGDKQILLLKNVRAKENGPINIWSLTKGLQVNWALEIKMLLEGVTKLDAVIASMLPNLR